ncbi:MAG TPA: TetR/AcrR family transcriptional regulator [Gemmatimonadaceae bacterium]|nr:TetR/AcrR family transcriptional regulator [Gemmatimonadaceae bacterium]
MMMAQNGTEPRQRLIDAAIELFGECGFRGATTRRIAETAGVNEVTLFRLFGSKSALLEEAVRQSQNVTMRRADGTLPAQPSDPQAELEAWAREQWRSMRERRSVIRKMMSEVEEHPEISGCLSDGWDRMRTGVLQYLERLRERGAIDPDVPLTTAVTMLSGTLFSDAMGRDIKRNVYPPERQAVAEYVQLFLRSLGYDAARRTSGAHR